MNPRSYFLSVGRSLGKAIDPGIYMAIAQLLLSRIPKEVGISILKLIRQENVYYPIKPYRL